MMGRGYTQAMSRLTLVVALLVSIWQYSPPVQAERGPEEWAFARLDHIRQQKVERIEDYCLHMRDLAAKAGADEAVVGFFNVNLEFARALAQGEVPESLNQTVSEIREGFNQYYIQHYLAFYDFLFVDLAGDVFYTLRKEDDLRSNLFKSETSEKLAACLAACPDGMAFVDFHQYGPSAEPAAFIVQPLRKNEKQIGWLVLQCSINKINMLFAWIRDLGRTGESFLVNESGYMLTESNFEGSSTILTKRLDDRNIQAKFAEKNGHRVVTDYRGFKALTSFEVVPFMGTRWLVVAKIDRDEVLTDHYLQRGWYYQNRVDDYVRTRVPAQSQAACRLFSESPLRVDMDEVVRATPGKNLETFGISTCSGVLGARPGHFAYLAHISPRDQIYGGRDTDLLGQMLMRIQTFDIHPSEVRDVSFTVVAPHLETLHAIIGRLIEEGFLLSQIRIMYMPDAETARVQYDCQDNLLTVTWQMTEAQEPYVQQLEDGLLLSDIVKDLMAQDNQAMNGS